MSNGVSDQEPDTGLSPADLTRSLALKLAQELADVGSVEVDRVGDGFSVTITPTNPKARSFGWVDFSEEVVLQVGEHGGRWELGTAPDDLAFLEDVARSVVAGRVCETFAHGRSSVSVTLSDGSIETETGYDGLAGCLPLPFWRRWSRRVRYAPYRY